MAVTKQPVRCVIVDDEAMSREVIQHYVEQTSFLDLIQTCSSAIEAASVLQKERIDLVYLDVEMPQMTGLELIKSLEQRPQIILITSKTDYAIEAFEVSVTDYLVKPPTYARFLKATLKACDHLNTSTSPADHIYVKTDAQLVRLTTNDIHWVEASKDYVFIKTPDRQLMVHATMKEMESRLPHPPHMRVHRSYIINLHVIESIQESTIIMGRKVIPIGASYRNALMAQLNLL